MLTFAVLLVRQSHQSFYLQSRRHYYWNSVLLAHQHKDFHLGNLKDFEPVYDAQKYPFHYCTNVDKPTLFWGLPAAVSSDSTENYAKFLVSTYLAQVVSVVVIPLRACMVVKYDIFQWNGM